MFTPFRRSQWLASALALTLATASSADDVFVKEGVVVKPLSKWKQRNLEKKLLRRPGNQVVIEGKPTVIPTPDQVAGTRARRSLRPLFGDRLNKRSEIVLSPPMIATPGSNTTSASSVIVSSPRSTGAPGDPLVMPGSVEVTPTPRVVRPPIMSAPRGTGVPLEIEAEPDQEIDRPAAARSLPAPADEIPPPVISPPRKASSSPNPTPTTEPAPVKPAAPAPPPEPVDPGPIPATPPPAPEPPVEPPLELPVVPRPA